MALEAKIHKDITEYEGKLVFGMTGKQLISVLIAFVIAVPTFIFTYKYIGVEVAGYLCMILPLPVLAVGFFKYKGVSFTELVKRYFNYRKNRKELRYCCRVSTDYYEEDCVNDKRKAKTARRSGNGKATVEYIRYYRYTADNPKRQKEKRKQIKEQLKAYRAVDVLQQKERLKTDTKWDF